MAMCECGGPACCPAERMAGASTAFQGGLSPDVLGAAEAARLEAPTSTSQTPRPPRSGSCSHHSETALTGWPSISMAQPKTHLLVLDDGTSKQTTARRSMKVELWPPDCRSQLQSLSWPWMTSPGPMTTASPTQDQPETPHTPPSHSRGTSIPVRRSFATNTTRWAGRPRTFVPHRPGG